MFKTVQGYVYTPSSGSGFSVAENHGDVISDREYLVAGFAEGVGSGIRLCFRTGENEVTAVLLSSSDVKQMIERLIDLLPE